MDQEKPPKDQSWQSKKYSMPFYRRIQQLQRYRDRYKHNTITYLIKLQSGYNRPQNKRQDISLQRTGKNSKKDY